MRVIGEQAHQDAANLIRITPTTDLVYNVLAVLHPTSTLDQSLLATNNNIITSNNENSNIYSLNNIENNTEPSSTATTTLTTSNKLYSNVFDINQNLLNSNIAGFISIVQIDIENDVMTLLCPCPGALPSNYLLVGSIKWIE
jgi:hypothetical protein